MARKKKVDAGEIEHVTDGAPCLCDPVVEDYRPPKISGDDLKLLLRQQRRESRLAEKGY